MGVEGNATTLTFTIGDAPTGTPDIKDGAVDLDKLSAEVQSAINAGGVDSTQLIKSTSAPTTRTDGTALQSQDLWADTDDDNQIYVRNAANNGWEKARDSSLVTLYNSLSSTVSTNTTNIATAEGDIVTLTTDTSANASAITSLTATVGTNTSAISTEQTARANADTALAADITSLTSTVGTNTSNITSESATRANADTALALDITNLTSTVSGNTASISSESVTRANADTALAADITSLTSTVGTNTSAISSEATTRASADTALTASITSLTSTVDDNTADITSEATTRANADTALASDITSLTSTVGTNTSAISSEATTRANADTALASDITSLTSTVGTNTSAISSEATTRASADAALTTSITNLTSTVGGNTASISTNATAITDINDNASASYVLQLNANGKVAQMVLESNADAGTGATSTISFLADTFKIDNDAGSSVSPFIVSGGTVLIDNARITNLSGTKIDVDTLAVKYFANVSSQIYDHQTTSTPVPLLVYGQAIRGAGGTTTYTGSNSSFVPFTIANVRNNASYTATLSAVLGNVNGGRVQYSLNNSTWVNASGGESNIYWNAGTYRGYTYTYQGDITNMTASQTQVYWRVYFSGSYNHTYMQLHVTMDNTT